MTNFIERVRLFHSLCNEKRVSDAEIILDQLTARAETLSEHIMLGYAQSRIGRHSDAERSLDLAWPHLKPREADTIHVATERATVKYHLGKLDEASAIEKLIRGKEWYQVSSTIEPVVRDAFNQLFRAKLLEDRDSVEGKSVFVIFSGGFGDAIEQVRNVKHLMTEGASVVFADPSEPLRKLFEDSGLPLVFEHALLENLEKCDAVAFGNMLNWRYYTGAQRLIPHARYLKLAGGMEPRLRLPASARKRKIGIVWRSDKASWEQCRHEPFRSMELSTLEPLLADTDIQFYSLQFGTLTDMEQHILARHGVVNASPYIHSFADMASIMTQLDLVITIDSSPAHLGGALGVPVWNMLAAVADWRWGDASQHSTRWYRSMRLFRQSILGDWSPVIIDIASALARVEDSAMLEEDR